MSPRALAKTVLHQARRARIRALAVPRNSPALRSRFHLPANACFDPLAAQPGDGVGVIRLDAPATFARPAPFVATGVCPGIGKGWMRAERAA